MSGKPWTNFPRDGHSTAAVGTNLIVKMENISKCISAIKHILSTTAQHLSSSSFMYLCFSLYCDACLNPSAMCVGVKTLHNMLRDFTYNCSVQKVGLSLSDFRCRCVLWKYECIQKIAIRKNAPLGCKCRYVQRGCERGDGPEYPRKGTFEEWKYQNCVSLKYCNYRCFFVL